MQTWDLLHREHVEMLAELNSLEDSLIDFLKEHSAVIAESYSGQQKEFLSVFERIVLHHFTVEEEALFPELKATGKNTGAVVDELRLEHQSIMEKHGKLAKASYAPEEKREILIQLIRELTDHSHKEERLVPPLVKKMNLEQAETVDKKTKRLGY